MITRTIPARQTRPPKANPPTQGKPAHPRQTCAQKAPTSTSCVLQIIDAAASIICQSVGYQLFVDLMDIRLRDIE
ncbi:MAG: hypothetical protein ACNA8L_10095 [Luteolibacter sp.]